MQTWTVTEVDELDAVVDYFLTEFPSGMLCGLSGDLGAGKTTFVRQFIKRLSPSQKVTSPSFVLHQSYETRPRVEHFDLYRLENVGFASLVEVGYFEAAEKCQREKGFLFVEWPEKVTNASELQLSAILKIEIEGTSRKLRLERRA